MRELFKDLQSALLAEDRTETLKKATQAFEILKTDARIAKYTSYFSHNRPDDSGPGAFAPGRKDLPLVVKIWGEINSQVERFLLEGCPRWVEKVTEPEDLQEFFRLLKPGCFESGAVDPEERERISAVLEIVRGSSPLRVEDLILGTARSLSLERRYIADLDDRSVQKILRELDSSTLALSLKEVSDEIRDEIFANVSNLRDNEYPKNSLVPLKRT